MISRHRAAIIVVLVGLISFWLGQQSIVYEPVECISRFAAQFTKT